MIELLRVACDLQAFFEAERWRFCFIGGLANLEWGRVRLTNDVDVSLLSGFGDEERYVDALLARFRPRRADAREFAIRHRVLLMETVEGLPVDVALAALPFEERVIERSVIREIAEGYHVRICSADDLVILKAFAARDQDWIDVEGVLIRSRAELDRSLVMRELKELSELKEEPEILARIEALFQKCQQ